MTSKEAIVVENLKRASDLIRESAQMMLRDDAKPEDGVKLVRTLMLRAMIPKAVAQEFTRLGGKDYELLGVAAGPNLGCAVNSLLGWAWLMDVSLSDGIVPVAFPLEQAEEIRRRLNEALG
jgi:hypothetical protein